MKFKASYEMHVLIDQSSAWLEKKQTAFLYVHDVPRQCPQWPRLMIPILHP